MPYQLLDDDGRPLDAHFNIVQGDIAYLSRGGRKGSQGARNHEYAEGLRTLLRRLSDGDNSVAEVLVDSTVVQALPIAERRIYSGDEGVRDPDELASLLASRMKNVGRARGAQSSGGNSTRRLRLRLSEGVSEDALVALLKARPVEKDFRSLERLPASELRKVRPEHVFAAVGRLRAGEGPADYSEATTYELVTEDGATFAPKEVFGIAATYALGFQVMPRHFTGGEGTVCFEVLRGSGYLVRRKGDAAANQPARVPLPSGDLVWMEGSRRLVIHRKRERNSAARIAKKSAFIAEHGRLYCEMCGSVPEEVYGPAGVACIEVHHAATAVADMEDGHETRLEDLMCICANCHKVEHFRIADGHDR